jgi:copper transport protein
VTRFAAIVLLLAVFALIPARASAHANLAESDPTANSVLDSPPERIVIRFTEPLEPALSEIRVLDSHGQQVDLGNSALDPGDPTVMSVSVGMLGNGSYTVAWRNVSTVDGHSVRGAYLFSVGAPLAASASAQIEPPLLQSPVEPFIRWLVLLSGLALVGVLAFRLLVSTPALSEMESEGVVEFRSALSRNTMMIAWTAVAVFLSISALRLVIQASVVYDTSPLDALAGPAWSLVFEIDWGRLWALRMVFAVATGAILFAMRGRVRSTPLTLLAITLGAGALLTISRSSHAAALLEIGNISLLNDFIHMMAVAVWVGGLFSLALDVPTAIRVLSDSDRRHVLSALIPRFSVIAGLSVAVLALTGIYSAWTQVTVPEALDTPYGRTLIAKIVLVGALLLIAALNLVWVRPRLSGDGRAAYWLRRLIVAEVIVAALVLLSVGFLTSLEPARQAAARMGIGAEDGLTFTGTTEGTEMTLEVIPGQVGPNTLKVSLRDGFGSPITNATDVRVRLSYLDADLGETAVSAVPTGDGEFTLTDQVIGIAGAWEVALVVQRPDAFDARTAFRFETSGGGEASSIALSKDTAYIMLGAIFGVLGLMFLVSALRFGGFQTRAGAAAMSLGVLGVIGASALLAGVLGSEQDVPERNPIPPTSESVATGLSLYTTHCQLCHGTEGLGDGPSSVGMNPPPADLVVHVPLHPDRALFDFIHDGIQETAMPGLGEALSDDDIWHIVNYIRTLQ